MIDRFSQASAELAEKNPYVCESCVTTFGHETIEHLDSGRDQADRHDRHGAEHGRQLGMQGPECTYNCDPMPFGD